MGHSRRVHLQGFLAAAGLAGIGRAAHAADSAMIGTWSGRLVITAAASLRLRLVITDDKTAKLISLDQGNAEIPADTVKLDGNSLKLTFAVIKGEFSGALKDNDHIEGTFTQMGRPLPLNLHRGEVIEEPVAVVSPPLTLPVLQALRAKSGTPAIGAAWQRVGVTFGMLNDGLRSSEDTVGVTMIDQWHWGSITKSMTATLAARLVEAKVVTWQTTVGSVLGDKVSGMQATYKDATFLHLLSHRAGLQPNIPMSSLGNYSYNSLPDARAERLAYASEALAQAPVGPLAAQMVYSNNGYIVAGAMLEALTGKPWEDLIQAHVFAPLKLSSAGFGPPGQPGALIEPVGHAVSNNKRIPQPTADNPIALGPAGRVHMGLRDMISYLAAHRDQPTSFLTAKSWETLHTPPFGGDYALGWVVKPDGVLWHNGSNTVWYGEILVDKKAGVVCTAVGNDGAPETQTAVAQVLMSARAAALA